MVKMTFKMENWPVKDFGFSQSLLTSKPLQTIVVADTLGVIKGNEMKGLLVNTS